MIRPLPPKPHSDDFRVETSTFQKMKEEIREFKRLGVRGFVFGILKEDEEEGGLIIDQERCKELLKIAREGHDGEKVRCTFHRAFDLIDRERMGEQLEVLINLPFTSLLTSGGSPTCTSTQGKAQIRKIVQQAGGRIEIIVGGGVRSRNLKELIDEIGAQWFHSSAVTGEGEEVDVEEVRRLREIMCMHGDGSVGKI
ncbi:583c8cb7-bed3-45e9-b6ad-24ede3e2bf82 [Sclerotinia trifoliorum]|uniref:Copper homeostasis protein cutC homolog n=1 Tax=Sclerotinia trifoliorum TaxID=28548 RepID=A0A8H2ZUX6_9HELO|nr:583c8cb7-bed3-45e9-b6ad-24ede3e2bf82 [Sclerotinia trifoliorum]